MVEIRARASLVEDRWARDRETGGQRRTVIEEKLKRREKKRGESITSTVCDNE